MSVNPFGANKLRHCCKRIHTYGIAVQKLGRTSGALDKILAQLTPFRNSLICFKEPSKQLDAGDEMTITKSFLVEKSSPNKGKRKEKLIQPQEKVKYFMNI